MSCLLSRRVVGCLVLSLGAVLVPRPAGAAPEGVACAPGPTPTSTAYGSLLTCAVESVGDSDDFRFTAEGGDLIDVLGSKADGSFFAQPCVQLLGPTGAIVAKTVCSYYGARITTRLAEPGTYTIRVSEEANNDTISYNLSLERLAPPSPSATPITFGQGLGGEVNPIGDVDLLVFSGAAGETIDVLVSKAVGLFFSQPCVQLFDPLGASMAFECSYYGARVTTRLQQSGTHTLRVSEEANDDTVAYHLALERLVPPSPSATPITFGLGIVDEVSPIGDVDLFSFWGVAGDKIDIVAAKRGGSFFAQPCVQLFDTLGTSIAMECSYYGAHIDTRLVQSGTYTVRSTEEANNDTVSYHLDVKCIGDCRQQPPPPCTFSVSPTMAAFGPGPGTGSVHVNTGDACPWNAISSDVTWLTITAGSTGSGSGTVSFSVAANATDAARLATLTVAGQTVTVRQDPPLAPRTSFTSYLAEGATGSLFNTSIALLNPGAAGTTARLRFLTRDGVQVQYDVPVNSRTRVTVDPESIPRLEETEFSTVVESDQPLVVERVMSWGANEYGGHAEKAVQTATATWYLAEGATHSGFDLFYLLQNANAQAADVTIKYLRPSPFSPLAKTYTVAPNSRVTIWVDTEDPGLASTDVSAVISAPLPIIVERAMYLNRPGQMFSAGHESAGIAAAAPEWFLAEGATGKFFDLFVLLANPDTANAEVEATYLLPDGTTVQKAYTVPGNSRFNIWVDHEDLLLSDTAVSTTIRSTNGVPIIAERAMWWPDGDWYEAHNSPGSTATGTRWALAEGEVDESRRMETYILIANTSAATATAKVTLMFEDGTTAEQTYADLPPRSRFNVPVGSDFPESAGRRFGALVESLGITPAQIVVERAMYWDAVGQVWAAGTNALGTKLQ